MVLNKNLLFLIQYFSKMSKEILESQIFVCLLVNKNLQPLRLKPFNQISSYLANMAISHHVIQQSGHSVTPFPTSKNHNSWPS